MRHFDREIEHLKELMLRMGAMVEHQINESIRALLERDTAVAQRVIDADSEVDRMELEIDQHTIELIAMMQPAAIDLRFVAAAMKITPELERILEIAHQRPVAIVPEHRDRKIEHVVPLIDRQVQLRPPRHARAEEGVDEGVAFGWFVRERHGGG